MITFKALVGLPGSGKSHLGKNYFVKEQDLLFFDDLAQNNRLDDLYPTGDYSIVVSDYSLIQPGVRSRFVKMLEHKFAGCKVEWWVWENNPEQCWANIQRRNDGRIISKGFLLESSKSYVYPENPTAFFPVWDGVTRK
jgi:hypothetical protein